MKITSLVCASILSLGLQAFAAGSGIVIGEISYGGTGCVAGTVDIKQNDSKIGKILLRDFKLTAQKSTERKACNLVVPLDVPAGVQVGVGPVDEIKGTQLLPSSTTKLSVNQEVFFAGSKGKVIAFQSKGKADGILKIQNSSLLRDLRWSPCGQAVNLRVNLTALLENPSRKTANVSLDSLNILKHGRLYWRQCQ